MKYSPIGLLFATALLAMPATGFAGEAEKEPSDESAEGSEEGGEGEGASGESTEEAAEESDSDAICKIDPAACPTLDLEAESKKPLKENIKAVQQRFIIKDGRVEIMPFWSFALNDQFVGHPGPGLGINYYITEALAVGINGEYYAPFNVDSSFNAQVRRAARVGVPLTEYQWAAAANVTYVPANGKFAGFQNFIFHYDAYVVGGIGAISTRPIPVIDPDNRNFQYEPKIAFNVGVGLKIFVNRWFAGVLEVRDYIFPDKLENLTVSTTNPADQRTWLGQTSLTNNVQAQLGVSVFIPFSFDYRLPKAGADTAGGSAK